MNWINRKENESHLEKLLINFIISNPEPCLGREELYNFEIERFLEYFSFKYEISEDKSEIKVRTSHHLPDLLDKEFTVTVLELISHLYGKLQTLVFKL